MLNQVYDPIAQLSADGAYENHRSCQSRRAEPKPAIPPLEDCRALARDRRRPYVAERNAALETIESQGRTAWNHAVGYPVRSLAETAMYRLKTLLGAGFEARPFDSQIAEVYARLAAMNT